MEVQQAARGYGEHLVASDAAKRIQECDNAEVSTFTLSNRFNSLLLGKSVTNGNARVVHD